jgi:hypothetical protein
VSNDGIKFRICTWQGGVGGGGYGARREQLQRHGGLPPGLLQEPHTSASCKQHSWEAVITRWVPAAKLIGKGVRAQSQRCC